MWPHKVKSIPPVKAVMTPFPHWIASEQPVSEAVRLMADHDIRHLMLAAGTPPALSPVPSLPKKEA